MNPIANQPGDTSPEHAPKAPIPPRISLNPLERELGGDLPCVVCGYNLRGLSIRAMCPECGTNVRATILAVVDPRASELQPIRFPRLVASGIVAWNIGAAAAALLAWLPHATDLAELAGLRPGPRPNVSVGVLIGVLISGLGSLALIRPHARIKPWMSLLAAFATILYIPLLLAIWEYQRLTALGSTGVRLTIASMPSNQALLVLSLIALIVSGIILCQRPNARLLVARSLVLRTGRVDRQTLYAVAASAAVIAFGAVTLRFTPHTPVLAWEILRSLAWLLMVIGSLLVTAGLLGALMDSLRIAQAIISPRPTLREVMAEGAHTPSSRFARILRGPAPSKLTHLEHTQTPAKPGSATEPRP